MKKVQWFIILVVAVILFLPLSNLIGLSGENEPIEVIAGKSEAFAKASRVLQNKCVDCHSPGMTRMPIYAGLPIAKQLMEHDIEEASERLLLTKEAYNGKEPLSPLMLARLEGVIRNNSMPPALYLLMHWNGKLNHDEKTTLITWIAEERVKHPWSRDAANQFKGEPVQPLPLTVDLNPEIVALGDKLFHDRRLSGDDTLRRRLCRKISRGGLRFNVTASA